MGDLPGVIEKLEYVAALGVGGIWLSPCLVSPMKDFGYDVSDYKDVDPRFGTLADFDRLVDRAHQLGLKVIIDQVWSHTSDAHAWFIESARAPAGPKIANWYVWADPRPDGTAPNNWLASFGGASWTWNARRRQYFLHNFLPEQPDLNYWNPEVQNAILDVARYWLDRGVDGFRLDVINYLFHDPALTDNPPARAREIPVMPTRMQRHIHDRSQPETLGFLGRLRALTDERDGRMMVGEVFDEPALPRQIEYTAGLNRLHTAYSFHFLSATRATPELFQNAIEAWDDVDGWPSWSLGNHDVARFATRLADEKPALVRVLMAALLCMPGTIFLYQGEELGLPQAEIPFGRLVDPFAIAAWTGAAGRDGARTPMPWTTDGPSAGFSQSAETWLPLDRRHRAFSAEAQTADPTATLAFTRRWINLRKVHPALCLGETHLLPAPEGVLAFERSHGQERICCLFELSGRETKVSIPGDGELRAVVAGSESLVNGRVLAPAYGGAVIKLT